MDFENEEESVSSILKATDTGSRKLTIVGIKKLSPKDIDLIADYIQNAPYLDEVTIEVSDPTYENSLTYEILKPLIPIFINHKSLTKVKLPNNKMDGLEQYYLACDIVKENKRIHTLVLESKFKNDRKKRTCDLNGESFYQLLNGFDSLVYFTTRNKCDFLFESPNLNKHQKKYDLAAKNIISHGESNKPASYLSNLWEPVVSRNKREAETLLNLITDGDLLSADGNTIQNINDRLASILYLAEGKELRDSVVKNILNANELIPSYYDITYEIGSYLTASDKDAAKATGLNWSRGENKPRRSRGAIDRIFPSWRNVFVEIKSLHLFLLLSVGFLSQASTSACL